MLEPTKAQGTCPVCGAHALWELVTFSNKGRLLSSEELTLTGCEACGMVHSAPLPSEAQLEAYYSDATTGWRKDKPAPGEGPEAEAEIERSLERKRAGYRRALALLSSSLAPPRADGETPRVLDFGCGIGAWLDVLQEDGWETFGIEPGPRGAAITAMRHTMLDRVPGEERFHLVVANHVFEHLRDPLTVLRKLAGSLVPGGQVFISVPDLGRLPIHQRIQYVRSDVHLMSYTFSGLRSMLALAGCEVEEHLVSADWDAWGPQEHARLRVLARRSERAGFPVEEQPLSAAIESLRAYQEIAEAERAQRRRAKKESKRHPQEEIQPRSLTASARRALAGITRRRS